MVAPTLPKPAPTAGQARPTGDEVFIEGQADISKTTRLIRKQVNLEVILDASGSMTNKIGNQTRLDVARDVLAQLVNSLPKDVNVGITVYGHHFSSSDQDKERSCQDIEILHPLGPVAPQKIVSSLQPVEAKGWTPIARSVDLAARDMSIGEQYANSVILISDGEETCDGNPAESARRVKQSPADLTVHTISFAASEKTKEQLQQIAQYSGGTFHEADDAGSLLRALEGAVATQKGTFLKVEVTGEAGRQVSTAVALRDPHTSKVVHQFMTWLEAPVARGEFDILVGTAPRVIYRRIRLDGDATITAKVSAGALRVEVRDAKGSRLNVPVELLDPGSGLPLRNFFSWYNQVAMAGTYDLLVHTAPAATIKGIRIQEGQLRVVPVGAGILRIELHGVGQNRIRTLVNLISTDTGETVKRLATWEDNEVVTGSYRYTIDGVMGKPSGIIKVEVDQSQVVRVNSGALRVDLTDSSALRVTAPVALLDGSGSEVLGEFQSWEDQAVLEGQYTLVVKTQPEVRSAISVMGSQHNAIPVRTPN